MAKKTTRKKTAKEGSDADRESVNPKAEEQLEAIEDELQLEYPYTTASKRARIQRSAALSSTSPSSTCRRF